MSEPVFVKADWAVWSKQPGTQDDYSVLASSTGLLSTGEFYQLLKHFTPGNPTADLDVPGSLPWVIFSRVGVGDKLYLGISVQAPTPDKDGTGRPITRTSYFCVPYEELAHAAVSYEGLYAAVANQDLLANADGGPVQLTIPRLDPGELAQAVRQFGETTVAATAAMLLGGPVTITGPGFPDLPTRLRYFDSVAALLPYGYRPYLTGATWSDSGAGDRFRFVFANRARDEASRVFWDARPQLPAGGPASAYFAELRRALDPASGGEGQLESLIDYFTRAKDATVPHKFEEPAAAIAILRGFILPKIVADGLDAGDASRDAVKQIFTARRVRELSPAKRVQLLKRLISFGEPEDFGLITEWFDEIADGNPKELLTDAGTACQQRIWSTGNTNLARDYLRFASDRGLADDLLAQLVVGPSPGTDQVIGLDAIGELLMECVINVPGGTTSHPRTQQALARNPAAGAALLARMAGAMPLGARSLEGAAEWLIPAVDRVVVPFVSLLGDAVGGGAPEPLDAGALHELNRYGQKESVRYLLVAASQVHRLRLALPGLATWLAAARLEQGRMAEAISRFWHDVTIELSPADGDEAVWLDLVLLITRNKPRALLSARWDQPAFSKWLALKWQELVLEVRKRGGDERAADELLESSLISVLQQVPWRADNAQAAAVRYLERSLTARGPRPRLTSAVLDSREALRQMPVDASAAEIAQACVRAQQEGVQSGRVTHALAESRSITSGAKALEVVENLHRALADVRARGDSFVWPIEFAMRFADGTFGSEIAAEFPALAGIRSAEQIEFRIKLLDRIGRISASGASPAIDADCADRLDRNRRDLEDVTKEARKRHSRSGGILGFIGGKGNQAAPAGPPAQGGQGGQGNREQGSQANPGGQGRSGGPQAPTGQGSQAGPPWDNSPAPQGGPGSQEGQPGGRQGGQR
jgi:hypothetical protein